MLLFLNEMVSNDVYNGHLARNPFNFQLFHLQGIPLTALDLTVGRKIYGRNSMVSSGGGRNCRPCLDIVRED